MRPYAHARPPIATDMEPMMDHTWMIHAADHGVTAGDRAAAAANAAALNRLLAAPDRVIVLPAGEVWIDATLAFLQSNAQLWGAGGDLEDAAGTILRWDGPGGGTMIDMRTPPAPAGARVPRREGMGLQRLQLDGRDVADTALRIVSVLKGELRHVTVKGVRYRGVSFECHAPGILDNRGLPVEQQAKINANQLWALEDVYVIHDGALQALPHAAAFAFDGAPHLGNTSLNTFVNCKAMYRDCAGFRLGDADGNVFINCDVHPFSDAGRGYGWDFQGVHAEAAGGGSFNVLLRCGWPPSNGCILRNGAFGPAVGNQFLAQDLANSGFADSAWPTREPGVPAPVMIANNGQYIGLHPRRRTDAQLRTAAERGSYEGELRYAATARTPVFWDGAAWRRVDTRAAI